MTFGSKVKVKYVNWFVWLQMPTPRTFLKEDTCIYILQNVCLRTKVLNCWYDLGLCSKFLPCFAMGGSVICDFYIF